MKIDIQRILCPTDFSASASHAFFYALAIAARHGAVVELLHVTENSAYANDLPLEGDTSSKTFKYRLCERLDEIVLAADADVVVETNLLEGVPYTEIVNRAKSWPADLIVIGTLGRTGMKHLLIGSVAERVVRRAPCPVCTVRHPDYVLDEGAGAS
ncbi:MAG: universal stress protein [Kiritimatiellia bacterium]